MGSLLQKRLEEELLSDLERGTVVWNDLGTVNRAAYARRLGVTKDALSRAVLQRFDDLGPKRTPVEEVLRTILEEDFQKGFLVFSKPGLINKLHYACAAGCSNTQYYKKLFREYEAKAGQSRTSDLLRAMEVMPSSRWRGDPGHLILLVENNRVNCQILRRNRVDLTVPLSACDQCITCCTKSVL